MSKSSWKSDVLRLFQSGDLTFPKWSRLARVYMGGLKQQVTLPLHSSADRSVYAQDFTLRVGFGLVLIIFLEVPCSFPESRISFIGTVYFSIAEPDWSPQSRTHEYCDWAAWVMVAVKPSATLYSSTSLVWISSTGLDVPFSSWTSQHFHLLVRSIPPSTGRSSSWLAVRGLHLYLIILTFSPSAAQFAVTAFSSVILTAQNTRNIGRKWWIPG